MLGRTLEGMGDAAVVLTFGLESSAASDIRPRKHYPKIY